MQPNTEEIRRRLVDGEDAPDQIEYVEAIEDLCDALDNMRELRGFFREALVEAERARQLHPSPDHLTLAFSEEAGEVVKAVLDHKEGKGFLPAVHGEIVQAMAMLIRLHQEGDPTVKLPPTEVR